MTTLDAAPYATDIDPYSWESIQDPHACDGAIRELAPVVYLTRYDVWATGRHEQVREMTHDWETYSSSSRPFHDPHSVRPEILLSDDPPRHGKVRSVVQRALSPMVMKRMRADFEVEAERLLDVLLANGTAELNGHTDLAAAFVLKVFPDAIGLPDEGREHLLSFGDVVFNTFGPQNEIFFEGMAKGAEAIAWVDRNAKPDALAPGGIGATIYEAAESGEVTWEEAELLVKTVFAAGSDTTILAMTNLLKIFAQQPEQWELLRADPSRARAAFEEGLRYDAPARAGGRITTREVQVEGTLIPEGARILLLWLAAGRDVRKWQDPDRYDLRRKSSGHLGLGFGIHSCVGQALARIEADVLFSALARRVERIELVGEPVHVRNTTVHGDEVLPLRLHVAS
jgi:cytochrome P450